MLTYDVAIIGSGPAGISAAISAACEGLKVVVLEKCHETGGQSKESAMIDNYPLCLNPSRSVSGRELIDGFIAQALRFGCVIMRGFEAERIVFDQDDDLFKIADKFEVICSRTVILANGVKYREHDAEGIDKLLYKGVHYGMPSCMPKLQNCNIAIVGGANSAGQAAIRMTRFPGVKVKILCRSSIRNTMSFYLREQIRDLGNRIEHIQGVDVTKLHGEDHLEEVTYITTQGEEVTIPCAHLQFWIGADPNTDWLEGTVVRDSKGFIDIAAWGLSPYQTSHSGIYAVGDIRLGSVKRVANAVGEGAAVMQYVMKEHF